MFTVFLFKDVLICGQHFAEHHYYGHFWIYNPTQRGEQGIDAH